MRNSACPFRYWFWYLFVLIMIDISELIQIFCLQLLCDLQGNLHGVFVHHDVIISLVPCADLLRSRSEFQGEGHQSMGHHAAEGPGYYLNNAGASHCWLNSLAPGKFEWEFRYVIFKRILVINGCGISCEIALIWMSLGLHWWSVNIGPGNGLVQSGNKPSPEPMLTQISVAIWRH